MTDRSHIHDSSSADSDTQAGQAAQAAHELERSAASARLRALLLSLGVDDIDIQRAQSDAALDLLVVDRLLVTAPRIYTREDVATQTGVPVELLRRLWRALGFTDVPEHERSFSSFDIEAVETFKGLQALGTTDLETAMQLARVVGSSMARIAEAEAAHGAIMGSSDDDLASAEHFAAVAETALPAMSSLLDFVWRRHLQAATNRMMIQRAGSGNTNSPSLAVGFADMVGFTLLSQHLSERELAEVVVRFEEISHDIVTSLGGRVVKMIGDEAMFVVEEVIAAAQIGLELAEAYADDDLLSDVRVGLAYGPVLVREGDYYGPVVNLAHRIVNIADPGTVIMSDDFCQQLNELSHEEFEARALRPRFLKDLGLNQLWWLGTVGSDPMSAGETADARRHGRWERVADVLRDLDELRGKGERLIAGARRVRDVIDEERGQLAESRALQPSSGDSERP